MLFLLNAYAGRPGSDPAILELKYFDDDETLLMLWWALC